MFLGGCLGTKHLKENEKLLYRQGIQAPRRIQTEALRDLYAQRPNRKILGLPVAPLVSIYYFGYRYYDQEKMINRKKKKEKKFDDKIAAATKEKRIASLQFRKQKTSDRFDDKIENGNTVMQWGEPISVFDSSMVKLTEERFSDYLFSKGYFTNKVTSKVTSIGKLVNVSYKIEPGRPYFIDSIFFNIPDTGIHRLVMRSQRGSYVNQGTQFDQDNFTKERERLDLLMKDHGYYDFSRQYIEYQTDTSFRRPERKVLVKIEIKDPARRGYHKQFRIDTVSFTTDAGVTVQEGEQRQHRTYRDIQYSYYADNYNLKILSQRVFIKPGELYSRSMTLNTQRQLANVDAFKFVNINFDTTDGKFNANIFASPLSRYEWTNEAGVSVTQGYPGPFYNMTFKKRNVFKGMETFDLNGRFGFEGVASATQEQNFYKSTEAGVNVSFTFPQFIWPFRDHVRFRHAQYNPKTKFTAGYAYTNRPEYRRTAISLNTTYSWNNKRTRLFSITPVNLSVIDASNLSASFQKLLDDQAELGNFSLVNSFRQSFVTSIIFNITWNHNNYGNLERNSSYIRTQVESGGTIWNIFKPDSTVFGLEYFKYLRLNVDMRRSNVISKNTVLAYRFNSGLAYAYGDNKSLPYEKFFFAGGSNSIRAWRPRRLGPGSLKPPESDDPEDNGLFDYSIESPADILLEGSVEVRQKLFGFVNGAIFIDAGNVWTFEPRAARSETTVENPGNSQFKLNSFYKEIAVGTGFGLRFDFTFLILRFDVGMKVWDPARDEGDRFVLNKVKFFGPYGREREPVIYNVGIGYPF